MTLSKFKEDIEPVIKQIDFTFINENILCNSCLGRIFAKLGQGDTDAEGLTNDERGGAIHGMVELPVLVDISDCWLCEGISGDHLRMAKMAILKMSDWEFQTFLVGSKFDPEIVEKEETVWSQVSGEFSEPIKAEFNREVGKLVLSETGKTVEFNKPDIVAIIDTMYESVDLQISPLFIYGRYTKYVRGIPQTRWPCRECRGKGCERCGQTGKMYQTSVEEIIGQHVMRYSGGKDHRFHGMGREDVDALMKGGGRPFVIEIKEPEKRELPLDQIMNEIRDSDMGASATEMRISNNDEVVKIKNARPEKQYVISGMIEGEFSEEKLKEVVVSLGGKTIEQRTPTRVKHRRADKVRKRQIKEISLLELSGNMISLAVTAEAGTYIKELVHGDEGRTQPSIAGELGVKVQIQELDVLEILDSKEIGAE